MSEATTPAAISLLMLVLCWSTRDSSASEVRGSVPECEYGWHRFRDKCFYFQGTSSSHTFHEARYECSKYFRASLAMIKSEEEQRFVEQLLKQSTIYNNVWLGAKWMPESLLAKSGYQWIDETPVFYHNKLLSPELIKGNSSMCLAMFMQPQYFGIWTPFNCNFYFHVLCERRISNSGSSSIPLTHVTSLLSLAVVVLSILVHRSSSSCSIW